MVLLRSSMPGLVCPEPEVISIVAIRCVPPSHFLWLMVYLSQLALLAVPAPRKAVAAPNELPAEDHRLLLLRVRGSLRASGDPRISSYDRQYYGRYLLFSDF